MHQYPFPFLMLEHTSDSQSPDTRNHQHLSNNEQRCACVPHQRLSEDRGDGLSEESFVVAARLSQHLHGTWCSREDRVEHQGDIEARGREEKRRRV
jgi:hypothetical protein